MKNRVQIKKNDENIEVNKDGPTPSKLDEAVEAVESMLDEMDGFRRFDADTFEGYVGEQMKAAEAEEGDVKKSRLTELRSAMDQAKTAFDGGGKARIKVYAPAAAGGEPEAEIEPAATETTEKAEPLTTDVMKSVVGSLRHHVNKADGTVVPIAKAGEARAALDRLATSLGLEPYDGETKVDPYRIAWKMEDAVCALGQLAKIEDAMTILGGIAGVAAAPSGGGPDVPAGVVEDDVAKRAATLKSAGGKPLGGKSGNDGWPLDFNRPTL